MFVYAGKTATLIWYKPYFRTLCACMVMLINIYTISQLSLGVEFEKCNHASLMTYYNDIHREMASIYSCVNGCVFHS